VKIQPFKLERHFAKYEFKTPFLLSSSDCESVSIAELIQNDPKMEEQLKNVWLGYTECEGDPNLRAEISVLYENMKPSNIICFSGAEEGIFIFMNTVLSPQDHIIVQYPAYQSLYEIAKAIGCRITRWNLEEENEWGLDFDVLEASIKPSTKAIVINFPHNPTGATVTNEEFDKIIKIAKKHDLYLFSDEVYRFLEFEENIRLPSAADKYEKAISLGVMSKAFGLAGLRIGWMVTKSEYLLNQFMMFKDYTTICNSAPSEFLATIALQQKNRILIRNLEIIERNLILLDHFFVKYANFFDWIRPKAGSVGFVHLKIDQSAEDFCLDVVESVGVLLLPAVLFDYKDEYFRIGFGRKNFPEALVKFEEYLQDRFYASSSL
jgi:aspartate/methionine/tyrosine aminotransferase